MTRLVSLGSVVVTVALLGLAREAWALGEEEWSAGLNLGGTLLRAPNADARGGLVGVEIDRGLTDVMAARAALALEAYDWSNGPERSTNPAMVVTFGVMAALDVLRVVPSAEVGVVGAYLGTDLGTRLGLELGLGADYLLDRTFSLGVALRGRILPVAISSPTAAVPSATAVVRLHYRF